MKSLLSISAIVLLVLTLAGCATVGEVQDLKRLQSTVEDQVQRGVEPDEQELRAMANRPLPAQRGVTYDLALIRASTAALFLGDLNRVREVRSLAVTQGTNPSIVASVLGTAGLAEQFSGNFVAAMRMQDEAGKVLRIKAQKQSRTLQDSRAYANHLANLAIAAQQAGNFSMMGGASAEFKRIAADQSYDAYGRAMAQLRSSRIDAHLVAERDGNYSEAHESLGVALERFRKEVERLDLKTETASAPKIWIAETLGELTYLAIGAGRISLAAGHVEQLRGRLSDLPEGISSQLISGADMTYRQALGDYAGALEAYEKRGKLFRAIENRWLVPRLRTVSIRAQHLGGLGRWTEAFNELKSVPEGLVASPSFIRDYYLGLRAMSAAMVGVDDQSTALILAREEHYAGFRGTSNYLMFFAAKTIIHYRSGLRHGSRADYGRAVHAGRQLAMGLRSLQASGTRRDAAVAEWLIRMAKEAYAGAASAAQNEAEVSEDDILDAALLLQSSDLDSDIAAAAARKNSIPGVPAAQLRRLQELQQASRRAQRQVAAAALAIDADPEQLARLAAEANEAARAFDRQLAQLAASSPQVSQAWGTSARIRVSDIQRRMSSDEGLAVFVPFGETTTLAILISSRGSTQTVLPVGREKLSGLVGRVRRSVTFDAAVQVPAFDVDAARELYVHLFSWADAALRPIKSLTVVATGPLGSIPFGVLLRPDARATRPEDYRSMAWLIRAMAINHAPSVPAWYAVTGPQAAPKAGGFLAWADPDFGGRAEVVAAATRSVRKSLRSISPSDARRNGSLPANLGDLLPPLPETKEEAMAIARALRASVQRDVFAGAAATRSSVLKESASGGLARRNVVMFATHGLVPAQVPGLDQPALALAREPGTAVPSLLQLDDVLSLDVDADWVLLSACSTAAADSVGGDPLSGLARGFFFAGARGLLVTHWEVESESASAITTRTIQRFVRNPRMTRAQALQQTSIELIDGRDASADWAHPAFWGAYALVGNGGRAAAGR